LGSFEGEKPALENNDLAGLKAFWSLFHGKFDRLAFGEGAEPFRLDRGVVDENILAAFSRDEPVPFRGIKPLDGTLNSIRHISSPLGLLGQRESRYQNKAARKNLAAALSPNRYFFVLLACFYFIRTFSGCQ
jgi:hypothetical protein